MSEAQYTIEVGFVGNAEEVLQAIARVGEAIAEAKAECCNSPAFMVAHAATLALLELTNRSIEARDATGHVLNHCF